MMIERNVRIPTNDPEVTLSADIYRPVCEEPVPALLTALPYRRDMLAGGALAGPARWYAERGYASIVLDLRGTGSSDGLMRPIMDAGQGDDGFAAVEWIATQPWCTGKVGMWGISAGGLSTLFTAHKRPPHLTAIIPMMCPLDVEHDAVHPEDARSDLHVLARRGGINLLLQLLPPMQDRTDPEEQRRWRRRVNESEPYFMDLARRRPGDAVWRDRVIDARSITVPALCVGGWRDLYSNATVRAFQELGGPKRLLMGPWMHVSPQNSPVESIDFLALALRWWDYWLRGMDSGVMDEPQVTVHVQGHVPGWRGFDSWPPTNDDFHLTMSEVGEYRPDPTIGAMSGLWRIGGGFGLPLDQHQDDSRSFAVTGEPLERDLLLVGNPEVIVHLADDCPQVQRLVVRLSDIDSRGRATLISAGVLCPAQKEPAYRITLSPVGYRLSAGHRLRIAVSDSDFPRLWPLADPRPIRLTGFALHAPVTDEDAGTVVDLPAVPAMSGAGYGASWTITRDPIHDGVEVSIGSTTDTTVSVTGQRLEMHDNTTATVRRDAPEAATIVGDYGAVVTMDDGETVAASAIVRCTTAELWVHGQVALGDTVVFSRIWKVTLGSAIAAEHVEDVVYPMAMDTDLRLRSLGHSTGQATSLVTG